MSDVNCLVSYSLCAWGACFIIRTALCFFVAVAHILQHCKIGATRFQRCCVFPEYEICVVFLRDHSHKSMLTDLLGVPRVFIGLQAHRAALCLYPITPETKEWLITLSLCAASSCCLLHRRGSSVGLFVEALYAIRHSGNVASLTPFWCRPTEEPLLRERQPEFCLGSVLPKQKTG